MDNELVADVKKLPLWVWPAGGGALLLALLLARRSPAPAAPLASPSTPAGPDPTGPATPDLLREIQSFEGSIADTLAQQAQVQADAQAANAGALAQLGQQTSGALTAAQQQTAAQLAALQQGNAAALADLAKQSNAANQGLAKQLADQAAALVAALAQLGSAVKAPNPAPAPDTIQPIPLPAPTLGTPARAPAPAPAPVAAAPSLFDRIRSILAGQGDPYQFTGATVDSQGFHTQTGGFIPRTYYGAPVFTRITTRLGTAVDLPTMYDPAHAAHGGDILTNSGRPESVIGRVQRRLSDLEQSGIPLTADLIQNEIRRTLGEAARQTGDYNYNAFGFVQGAQLVGV